MKSYRPEELFDENGRFHPELAELAPQGERRMGANPHANGGLLLEDLDLPDYRDYAVAVPQPGRTKGENTRVLGGFLPPQQAQLLDRIEPYGLIILLALLFTGVLGFILWPLYGAVDGVVRGLTGLVS